MKVSKRNAFLGLVIIAIIGGISLLKLQLTVWSPYPWGWLFVVAYAAFAIYRIKGLAATQSR